uniref:GOLD domain-containing protein n=1 Tax=Peronospora matthiolae TaxID=2874970 RepID=A0AAV1U0P9_9STRA
MTRRAKERRTMRVHAKQQLEEERLLRDKRLRSRASWKQLLSTIDGPSSSRHVYNSCSSSSESPIVDELQWKSSQVPIAASGNFQLPIKLDARKGQLLYSFRTRTYDVTFGVQMICADGSLIQLLEPRRYESQKQHVEGKLALTGPAMVLLLWDNSFSWVNTKQLAYHVELKQEILLVSEAEKTQMALQARLTRQQELLQRESEYDGLETQVQTEAQTIELLRHQIEELQTQLEQREEAKENIAREKHLVGEHVEDLCWELQALSWRCLDEAARCRILDCLDAKDLIAWSLTSKKWFDRASTYLANRRKSVESNEQASA